MSERAALEIRYLLFNNYKGTDGRGGAGKKKIKYLFSWVELIRISMQRKAS